MSKRLDNLSRVFLELRDRYGANDPLVLQVKQELTVCEDAESLTVERILPFGERRALISVFCLLGSVGSEPGFDHTFGDDCNDHREKQDRGNREPDIRR